MKLMRLVAGRRSAADRGVILTTLLMATTVAFPEGIPGIDLANKNAFAENAGWANFAPTNGGVTVHFDGTGGYLTGCAWGENIGWIKLGANAGGPYANATTNNWGVNMNVVGSLSGYAWGENVGWIKFDPLHGVVQVNMANGQFSGVAWGENIGWLKFSGSAPDYGVRTLAFDTQPLGTPNWWLAHFGVAEAYDAGDGVPAWKKYVMDTDPTVAGSYLRITSVSNTPSGTDVIFWPASTRRYYTLRRCDDLQAEGWNDVEGRVNVRGSGGADSLQDASDVTQRFYRVTVEVVP
ncbi:MAG: hypothetical protein WCK89_22420 [bacterium]